MLQNRNSEASNTTTVYRPRRRCPKCGLVNQDFAKRCRRCHRHFEGVDPAAASEQVFLRHRARRAAVVATVVAVLVGLAAVGYTLHVRSSLQDQFDDLAHDVAMDLSSIEIGAKSDAVVVLDAIDSSDALTVLEGQEAVWTDRLDRCTRLRSRFDQLVPRNTEQAATHKEIDLRLGTLEAASRVLASASTADGLETARSAAERLLDEGR